MSWEFCSILLDKYFEQKRPPDNKCGKGTTPSNRADWQYWTLFNNAFQAPLRQLFSLAKSFVHCFPEWVKLQWRSWKTVDELLYLQFTRTSSGFMEVYAVGRLAAWRTISTNDSQNWIQLVGRPPDITRSATKYLIQI
ncbi:hypothetical protein T07_9708 [Trichinella nelsoni]|uniref:Uncharacterized protein n=4 Tax=Trichinella TaxID=6333 RepID=A0A0V1LC96_9BILA|nr:hypothetical protein T07_9708 [Trichinella nelsoni]KRY14713.1 hypothetical protein T12_9730 [Trichinella patagoniensis]KRY60366.1 hypothetical protein T03_14530 [Trichinella britovi]KRZ57120.1 hypothetical protein T02_4359 [Trichinella nativa]KRZ88038.1 hypothetical protein T08_4148 [Trichinella sp. T8]